MVSINGMPAHETACPDKPVVKACWECGYDVKVRAREARGMVYCADCRGGA
jgi:hypothetical protein